MTVRTISLRSRSRSGLPADILLFTCNVCYKILLLLLCVLCVLCVLRVLRVLRVLCVCVCAKGRPFDYKSSFIRQPSTFGDGGRLHHISLTHTNTRLRTPKSIARLSTPRFPTRCSSPSVLFFVIEIWETAANVFILASCC